LISAFLAAFLNDSGKVKDVSDAGGGNMGRGRRQFRWRKKKSFHPVCLIVKDFSDLKSIQSATKPKIVQFIGGRFSDFVNNESAHKLLCLPG
jgi:hypothetical protein